MPDVSATFSAAVHTPFLKLFLPWAFVVPESCGSPASSLCSQIELTPEFELTAFPQQLANWIPGSPAIRQEASGNKGKLSSQHPVLLVHLFDYTCPPRNQEPLLPLLIYSLDPEPCTSTNLEPGSPPLFDFSGSCPRPPAYPLDLRLLVPPFHLYLLTSFQNFQPDLPIR